MIRKRIVDSFDVLGVDVGHSMIKGLDEQSGWVCDLFDSNDNVLATDRDFPVGNAPFPDLNDRELEYLQGKSPKRGWLKPLIQRWMTEHQTERDEDDKVLNTDPLYFIQNNSEYQLLAKINKYLNPS